MKLYSYALSSTAYRVRIALNLKAIVHTIIPVDLARNDHRLASFHDLNPGMGVPVLVTTTGGALTQSMAILSYLDHLFPTPPLRSDDPWLGARIDAAAQVIASEVHPVNNLKVRAKLEACGIKDPMIVEWMRHWMTEGLMAYQALIDHDAAFSFGATPSLADICLIPQMYNAHRWDVDLAPFARLIAIERRCLALPAFDAARPENQKDYLQ